MVESNIKVGLSFDLNPPGSYLLSLLFLRWIAMPNADLSNRTCDHCGVVGALFPGEQNREEVWIHGSCLCP